jgi:hypothetical protein
VALAHNSESRLAGAPEDYARHHPDEDPREWGWHASWGRGARVGGWVVVAILLLMTTATNYQFEYHLGLWLLAGAIAVVLFLDALRRRNQWRRR